MTSQIYFDTYSLRARIAPVIVVSLPGILAALAWIPELESAWEKILGLVGAGILSILISQLGRDRGKNKQDELFRQWGGKPTTLHLRHQESSNKAITSRRHNKLQELMEATVMPTEEEERADPQAADDIYEACINYLRSNTRDKERFPLIYEENCNYGFRRNLWGLKPFGIAITIISIFAIAGHFSIIMINNSAISFIVILACIIDILMLLVWVLVVTPKWVRMPAEEYAEQLLNALDQM